MAHKVELDQIGFSVTRWQNTFPRALARVGLVPNLVALKAQCAGVDNPRFRRISALDAADLEEFLAAAL